MNSRRDIRIRLGVSVPIQPYYPRYKISKTNPLDFDPLAIKEANNTQSIRGIALLPEDIQNDLISFLIDKPWNKQDQKPKKRQPMPASNTTAATSAAAADGT